MEELVSNKPFVINIRPPSDYLEAASGQGRTENSPCTLVIFEILHSSLLLAQQPEDVLCSGVGSCFRSMWIYCLQVLGGNDGKTALRASLKPWSLGFLDLRHRPLKLYSLANLLAIVSSTCPFLPAFILKKFWQRDNFSLCTTMGKQVLLQSMAQSRSTQSLCRTLCSSDPPSPCCLHLEFLPTSSQGVFPGHLSCVHGLGSLGTVGPLRRPSH